MVMTMNNLYINSAVSIALCACASLSQAETRKTEDQGNENDMLLRVQALEQRIQEMEACLLYTSDAADDRT